MGEKCIIDHPSIIVGVTLLYHSSERMSKFFRKIFKKISIDEQKEKESVFSNNRAVEMISLRDDLITFGYLASSQQQQQGYFPLHSLITESRSTSSSRGNNNTYSYTAPVSVVIDSCSSSVIDYDDDSDDDEEEQKVLKLKFNQKLLQNTPSLNYCARGLIGLNSEIFTSPCLQRLERLQLCCNAQLQELPNEICLLRRLKFLNLNGCGLMKLPETVGYLQQLEELWLTGNRLRTLPTSISGLQKLRKLGLAENEFKLVPRSVLLLNRKQLTCLQLDGNPFLRAVPSEIAHFSQLSRFHVEGCPRLVFNEREAVALESELSASHPPSLLECSARALVRHRQPVLFALPVHLKGYLSGADWCSLCQGPMFEARVIRCRQIKRMERIIPVLDELCCAHWPKEESVNFHAARIECLLSPLPRSTPPALLGELEAEAVIPFNRFDPQQWATGARILARFTESQKCTLSVPLSLIVPYPKYPVRNYL